MNLLSFCLSCLLFLPASSANNQALDSSLKVSNKPARHIQQESKTRKEQFGIYETEQWKDVSPFKDDKLSLYQWTENPHLLISVQKDKGLPINQIPDLKAFFNKTEKEKLIAFSKTSIQNRTTAQSQIENTDNTALFWTNGTYLDFQKNTAHFEDLSFYHKKVSLHILIHSAQAFTKKETQAVYSFVDNVIQLSADLDIEEKKEFLSLTKKIKNENN